MEAKKRRGRDELVDGITDSMHELWEMGGLASRRSMGLQRVPHDLATKQQQQIKGEMRSQVEH